MCGGWGIIQGIGGSYRGRGDHTGDGGIIQGWEEEGGIMHTARPCSI